MSIDSSVEIDGASQVVGVIGWPVQHSLSPPMHNAAFRALGLNWVYVAFEVPPDNVGAAIEGMRALDIRGLNVTIPHKTAVVSHLDEISPTSRQLGVVNTIVNTDGYLRGDSTDGAGFIRALAEAGEGVTDNRVVLIGAGGSARAVALAAAQEQPEELVIVNRTPQRAVELAELVGAAGELEAVRAIALDSPEVANAVNSADVIIDATSVGMYPHADVAPVISAEWLRPCQLVCDLTYNPRDTVLLQAAREAGARILDGTGMLVHQGAIAFEQWTGQEAPVEVMRLALLEALDRATQSADR